MLCRKNQNRKQQYGKWRVFNRRISFPLEGVHVYIQLDVHSELCLNVTGERCWTWGRQEYYQFPTPFYLIPWPKPLPHPPSHYLLPLPLLHLPFSPSHRSPLIPTLPISFSTPPLSLASSIHHPPLPFLLAGTACRIKLDRFSKDLTEFNFYLPLLWVLVV